MMLLKPIRRRLLSTARSAAPPAVSVIAHEYGHSGRPLPTFACDGPGSIAWDADADRPPVRCRAVERVPGCFVLDNVLTPAECAQFVAATEAMGYDEDAPVSLPHSFRHMDNCNWLVDATIPEVLFERARPALPAEAAEVAPGAEALGINARFRCYRYSAGDYFKFHTDGSWPSSLAVDGAMVWDAFPGERWSQLTFLLLLTDGFEGGRTLFEVGGADGGAAEVVGVRTPLGGALCFPHGGHPQHVRHAGEEVESGEKFMIRTELMYRRSAQSDAFQRGWFREGPGQ
jgi:hypothetical protein